MRTFLYTTKVYNLENMNAVSSWKKAACIKEISKTNEAFKLGLIKDTIVEIFLINLSKVLFDRHYIIHL